MIVSINPSYYCNFRCEFCYLTKQQLSDRKMLDLSILEKRLDEILSYKSIEMVDLYGGEVSLLPHEYVMSIKNILHARNIYDINIITNLSVVNDIILDKDFYISVSYDFDAREKSNIVWKNLMSLNKKFSILMLASPELLKLDVDYIVNMFNLLSNLENVEVKPYSTNQANCLKVSNIDYETFVKKLITHKNRKFHLTNELYLKGVISFQRNSFSDDHIYITPSGNYSVLEFDLNDKEYFLEYSLFKQYLNWCNVEKDKISKNKFCSNCSYYGRCLSEHLRDVKTLDDSCNGFKFLIEWYEKRND